MRPLNEARMRAFEAILTARPDLLDSERGMSMARREAKDAAESLAMDECIGGSFAAPENITSTLNRIADEAQEYTA